MGITRDERKARHAHGSAESEDAEALLCTSVSGDKRRLDSAVKDV